MYCSKCGIQNDDSARFCSSCGNLLMPVQEPLTAGTMTPPPMAAPGQMPSPHPVMSAGEAMHKPLKPYKAEFVMGLIGSITGIVMFIILLIVGLASWIYSLLTIASSVLALASAVLGFIGSSQVNCGKGKGGILLTIGGVLGFAAIFLGLAGWLTIFYFPLLLVSGIMALARRKRVESAI